MPILSEYAASVASHCYYYLCILFKPSMDSNKMDIFAMHWGRKREREFKRLYIRRFLFCCWEKLNQLCSYPNKN